MKYREEFTASLDGKKAYVEGLENLINKRQREAKQARAEYAKGIFTDAEKYRHDLRALLGWPLVGGEVKPAKEVSRQKLSEEETHTVYRLGFEVLDGLVLSGLYFEYNGEGKRPFVLVQHGGLGTPELISGLYGDTGNYNDMLERVIKNKAHAFAPQLLLWNKEYGTECDRIAVDTRLKMVGSSVAAIEIYALMCVLGHFEAKSNVKSMGMVGLSYGGFYTLFLSALDVRIKSAISCSFFNTREQIPWADWSWFDMAGRFDDAEIAALVYPRRLCIEIGSDDELFKSNYGEQSYQTLKRLCADNGVKEDWLNFIKFNGVHEFCTDDAPIRDLINYLDE